MLPSDTPPRTSDPQNRVILGEMRHLSKDRIPAVRPGRVPSSHRVLVDLWQSAEVSLPRHDVDPDGLLEYSVVFTDRSLNHMSKRFVGVMQDIIEVLCTTYGAETVAVVPGGGTYAMEAVARQLATGRRCLVVRNGMFSYRWSQIFEAGSVASDVTVCRARPVSDERQAPWTPAPVAEVVEAIERSRPEVVFAAHVETAAGMLLPDDYLRTVAAATHGVGGLFVLDCIASGALWVDMSELGVDVLLSAPQKGWSGSPCAGYVMLSEAGRAQVMSTTSTSFAVDLQKWLTITEAYTQGQTPYHATMPTDSLARDAALMLETRAAGLSELRQAQVALGTRVRGMLAERGYPSVAAEEFAAPSVVVVFTDDPEMRSGAKLAQRGVQVAAGVPLMCGEREDFSTFRLGLFGLDKLTDIDGTVGRLEAHLE
jgi:aspartate aminotransferase-like enzyme